MESTQESMEDDPSPVIPDYFVGDIVAVTEFKKPNIGNKIGVKVLGGIARVMKVNENTCDLNYYLEGRRVKEVPFEFMRRAPPSFDSAPAVGSSGNNADGVTAVSDSPSSSVVSTGASLDSLPGSWEAQALRQAETLARAGSKRERKQAVHFEVTKPEPQRRNKQAKPTANPSPSDSRGGAGGNKSKNGKNSKSSTTGDDEKNDDDSCSISDIPELPILPRNSKAFKQGKWRREPFDFREYERLNDYEMAKYCVECNVSSVLKTSLPDGKLITQAYNDEAIVERYIQQEIIDFNWSNEDVQEVNGVKRRKHKLMKDTNTLSLLFKNELSKNNDKLSDDNGGDSVSKRSVSTATASSTETEGSMTNEKRRRSAAEKREKKQKEEEEEEWQLREAVEDSLIRSLIASRLDGMVQEVFSRAVEEGGALSNDPLTLTTAKPISTQESDSADFDKSAMDIDEATPSLSPELSSPTMDVNADSVSPATGSVEHGYLREQPVWGIDSYTRYHIRLTLEDSAEFQDILAQHRGLPSVPKKKSSSFTSPSSTSGVDQEENTDVNVRVSCDVRGIVIKAYDGDKGGLAVNLGDEVLIKDKTSSERGWYVVNVLTGAEGWVPPSCLDTTEDVLITNFIERCLLPAINLSPEKACFMTALKKILAYDTQELADAKETSSSDASVVSACGGMSSANQVSASKNDLFNLTCPRNIALGGARALLKSIEERGGISRASVDFRIHPKGTGVIVNDEKGVKPHTFVNEYIGELYPPYRWFERQDAIALAQKLLKIPPTLPDFYNIVLERPSDDTKGYGILYVDASKRANFSSSLSHSCSPNCEPRLAIRNGRLCIVLVTLRSCAYGEELTFDYGAVTGSAEEYGLAICLCGTSMCRQSFLDFVASDSTQQLLMRWHSPTDRFALLFDASLSKFRSEATKVATDDLIKLHGLALSGSSENDGQDKEGEGAAPFWLRRFIAKTLSDFIDKERVYLPIQLKLDGVSSQNANMEARSVIEQRMQSLVSAISCVENVLKQQRVRGGGASNKISSSSVSNPLAGARKKLLNIAAASSSSSSSAIVQPNPTPSLTSLSMPMSGGFTLKNTEVPSTVNMSSLSSGSMMPPPAMLMGTPIQPSPPMAPPPPMTAAKTPQSTPRASLPLAPMCEDAPLKVVGETNLINMVWHDKNSLVRALLEAVEKEEKTYAPAVSSSTGEEEEESVRTGPYRVLIGKRLRRLLGIRSIEEEKEFKLKKKLLKKYGVTNNPDNLMFMTQGGATSSALSPKRIDNHSMEQVATATSSSSTAAVAQQAEMNPFRIPVEAVGAVAPPAPAPTVEVEAYLRDALNVTDATSCSVALLKVRELLLEAAHATSVPQISRSKHLAAADSVLLWAHTRTFAIPHSYEAYESEPVSVMACDLGAPLKRCELKSAAKAVVNSKPPSLPPYMMGSGGGDINSLSAGSSNMTNVSSSMSSMSSYLNQSPVKVSEVLTTADYDQVIKNKEVFLHNKFDISQVPDNLTLIRRKSIQDNGSIFKGVRRKKGCKNWQALINRGGKQYGLGTFESEELAATVFTKTSWLLTHNASALNALQAAEPGSPTASKHLPPGASPKVKTEKESHAEAAAAAATLAALFSSSATDATAAAASVAGAAIAPVSSSQAATSSAKSEESTSGSQSSSLKKEDQDLKANSISALLNASSSSSSSSTGSTATQSTLQKEEEDRKKKEEEEEEAEDDESLVGRNEVVLRRRARYGPYFLIGRLMDWFNTEEGSGNLGTNNSTYSTYASTSTSKDPVLEVVASIGDELPIDVLFGCVLLPEPAHCYQSSIYSRQVPSATTATGAIEEVDDSVTTSKRSSKNSNSSNSGSSGGGGAKKVYGKKERTSLFNMLNDKTVRRQCWDKKLSAFFKASSQQAYQSRRPRLLGSPVVDFLQGSYKGLDQVLRTLAKELRLNEEEEESDDDEPSSSNKRGAKSASGQSSSKKQKGKTGGSGSRGRKSAKGEARSRDVSDEHISSTSLVDDSAVVDNEQSWVQCDACSKWRRVPWYVDADMITDFVCASSAVWGQNFSCSDPEEDYDASSEKITTVEGGQIKDFEVGMMLDTYCLVNKCWYEAKVIKVGGGPSSSSSSSSSKAGEVSGAGVKGVKADSASHEGQVQIHFKGWGKTADEWIDKDSDRLSPYRLHTCGTSWRSEVRSSLPNKSSSNPTKRSRSKSGGKNGGSRAKPRLSTSKEASNSNKKAVELRQDDGVSVDGVNVGEGDVDDNQSATKE